RGRGSARDGRGRRRAPLRRHLPLRGGDRRAGHGMTGRSARREILLSRETLLGLVAVLVLAGVCVLLGLWQYGRYEDRRDEAAVVSTNYEAEPVALEAILPEEGQPLPAEHAWAPVSLHGRYCAEDDC